MTLSVTPEMQALIDKRLKTGAYATPEDVVAAALALLDREEPSQ